MKKSFFLLLSFFVFGIILYLTNIPQTYACINDTTGICTKKEDCCQGTTDGQCHIPAGSSTGTCGVGSQPPQGSTCKPAGGDCTTSSGQCCPDTSNGICMPNGLCGAKDQGNPGAACWIHNTDTKCTAAGQCCADTGTGTTGVCLTATTHRCESTKTSTNVCKVTNGTDSCTIRPDGTNDCCPDTTDGHCSTTATGPRCGILGPAGATCNVNKAGDPCGISAQCCRGPGKTNGICGADGKCGSDQAQPPPAPPGAAPPPAQPAPGDCICDKPGIPGGGNNGYRCPGDPPKPAPVKADNYCEFPYHACTQTPGKTNPNKGHDIKGIVCSPAKYTDCTCNPNAGGANNGSGKNGFKCKLNGQPTGNIYCADQAQACIADPGNTLNQDHKLDISSNSEIPEKGGQIEVYGVDCKSLDPDKTNCACDMPNLPGVGNNGYSCQQNGQDPKHFWCEKSVHACQNSPGVSINTPGGDSGGTAALFQGIVCTEPRVEGCKCDSGNTPIPEAGFNGFSCANYNGSPYHDFCDKESQACVMGGEEKLDNNIRVIGIHCAEEHPVTQTTKPPCVSFDATTGECLTFQTAFGDFYTTPSDFVGRIFALLLGLSGGIALLLIIKAGYQLMTSQGNPEKIQQARDQLVAAIVGLLFIIFSFVILHAIGVDIIKLPGVH